MTGDPPLVFVPDGHLGGYVKSDRNWPNGDPYTYCTAVWDWLVGKLCPSSALDLGCAEGHAVKYLHSLGVNAYGVEACREALRCSVVPPEFLVNHDYTKGPLPAPWSGRRYGLVWCCEFVEHVEAAYEENFLSTFELADVVCMTHAFPGQAGHHHVNCQPREYWEGRMASLGFVPDVGAIEETRALDRPGGHWGRSGLVFVKASRI